MKALLASVVVTAVVSMGSSASAQYGSRWERQGVFAQQLPAMAQQQRAFARGQDIRTRSTNRNHDVYDIQGNYISSDPDLFIRNELARVPPNRGDD